MNHVIGRGDDTNLASDRNHQGFVDFEQIVHHRFATLGTPLIGQFTLGPVQRRDEANAFPFSAKVVIAPAPLHARNFDGQIGIGGVFHGDDHLGCRPRHSNHYQEGHSGPDHLHHHGFMEIRSLVPDRLAVFPDGVKHH